MMGENKDSAPGSPRLRIRLQKGFFTSVLGLTILGTLAAVFLTAATVFTVYYIKYSRMIDARLSGHVLPTTTPILSAPEHISVGQAMTPVELTGYLSRVGYRTEGDSATLGQYKVQGSTVDIRPSKLSYFGGTNALAVTFSPKAIRSIRPLSG